MAWERRPVGRRPLPARAPLRLDASTSPVGHSGDGQHSRAGASPARAAAGARTGARPSPMPHRPVNSRPVALLLVLLLALHAAPAWGGEGVPTVSFLGVHGTPDMPEARVLDVGRWVALSLEDQEGIELRDLDQTGAAVFARREFVLTETFLDAARKEVIGGQKLFEAARIDEAEESFARARQLLDRGAEYLRDPSLLVDAYLYSGLCASWTGDAAAADRWFALAAAVDPARTLDPVRFPEEEIGRFDRVKAALAAGAPAVVDVGRDAAGAQVLVDGRPAGTAPARIEVRPGRHYVVANGAGGRAAWVVDLEAGQTFDARGALRDAGLRPLEEAEAIEGKSSGRTMALYEQLARAAGTDIVVLGAFDTSGNFRLQAYGKRDGRFARAQVADVLLTQKGPDEVVRRLVERVVATVSSDGGIAEEAAAASVAPVFLGRNPVLNSILLGQGWTRPLGTGTQVPGTTPVQVRVPVARRPLFWAILGGAAAAAAVGVAVGVNQSQATTPPSDTGVVTIRFGSSG